MSDISAIPDEVEERIGAALRQWRVESGLSQDDLAERASLSRSAIQAIETGRGSRLETLVRVLRALGRTDALDALAPREGPTPIELLAAERRGSARSRATRVGRSG